MPFRPIRLARPFACASGLSLHPLDREASAICTGFGVITLCVTLLATEPVLLVFFLALTAERLPAAVATFALARLAIVVLHRHIEEVFLMGSGNVCALAFYQHVS